MDNESNVKCAGSYVKNDSLKSALWSRLNKFGLDEDSKNKLIDELDVLSELIIDTYLEYNKDRTKTKG